MIVDGIFDLVENVGNVKKKKKKKKSFLVYYILVVVIRKHVNIA